MVLKAVDVIREMHRIEALGFVATLKSGDTGVGYTLETLLGLRPTNVRGVADLSYRNLPVEVKAQRAGTQSMTTLFACEPAHRTMNDFDLIQKYGYTDAAGRKALYVTLNTRGFIPQGLRLVVARGAQRVAIEDREGARVWEWDYSQFSQKLQNLLLVRADTRGRGKSEQFHYDSARLCWNLDDEKFTTTLIDTGLVTVDLRAHIKPGKSAARNHGTAFRTAHLGMLESCYETTEAIL